MEFLGEPHRAHVVVGNAYHERNPVVGAHLGEGTGSVAGGLDNKYLVAAAGESGADAVGLSRLEGTGLDLGADLRVVAGEGDEQVLEAELLCQSLALIGNRPCGVLQCPFYRKPVVIAVDALLVGVGDETLLLIDGSHEGGGVAERVLKGPALVFEFAAGRHVDQTVLCRKYLSHIYKTVISRIK